MCILFYGFAKMALDDNKKLCKTKSKNRALKKSVSENRRVAIGILSQQTGNCIPKKASCKKFTYIDIVTEEKYCGNLIVQYQNLI